MARLFAAFVAAALFALTGAPAAQAAPTWQTFPDPPGRVAPVWDGGQSEDTSGSYIGTTPYVSTTDPAEGLRVWRLDGSRTHWLQVGGRLDDPSAEHRTPATLVRAGSTIWAHWGEYSENRTVTRLARLVGGQFQPIAAGNATRPGTERASADVAAVKGRVYVAIVEEVGLSRELRVMRVAEDGSSYEPLGDGLIDVHGAESPELGVAGGRLYLSYRRSGEHYEPYRLARLDSSGTAWEQLAVLDSVDRMTEHDGYLHFWHRRGVSSSGGWLHGVSRWTDAGGEEPVGGEPFDDEVPGPIASAGGLLYVAGHTSPGPDAIGPAALAAFDGSDWQAVPTPPGDPEYGMGVYSLGEAPDGGLWALYAIPEYPRNGSGPFKVHLAHYGEPLAPGVDEPDGPPAGPSTGTGGFTTPGGQPVPDADDDPRPPRRGACANALLGSARGDRIVGTRGGDRIAGRAGADALFGRAGADCIFGGGGADVVSGGAGRDAIGGGIGSDRIAAGAGADSVAAGPGADSIHAVGGGVDRVNCGAGRDTVRLSRNDLVKNCERVLVRR